MQDSLRIAKYNTTTLVYISPDRTPSFVHLRISEAGMVHVVADTGRQQ